MLSNSIDTELIKFFIISFTSLFALVNPIGLSPMFISLVDNMNAQEKKQIAAKGVFTAGLTLTIFLFIGELIFQFFGITIEAFKIAGGILFMRSSFNLIEVKKSRTRTTPAEEENTLNKERLSDEEQTKDKEKRKIKRKKQKKDKKQNKQNILQK